MKLSPKLVKSLILIAAIILFCTFISRFLNSSETLSEFASKHPELNQPETTTQPESESESQSIDVTESIITKTDISSNTIPVESTTEDFSDEYASTDSRIYVADDFYYEPIPTAIKEKISGVSYPDDASISLDELNYVSLLYYDFNQKIKHGELICNAAIAKDITEIFYDLYKAQYQIEKIKLIDEYQADDHLSMLDNNTSCFNYRFVDDTTKLSKHAYGLAIDINPYYNPYVTYENGKEMVSPEGSEIYADRTLAFPYKIDENDLCYKLFILHGFKWGGSWNSCKDYQHFQKEIQ